MRFIKELAGCRGLTQEGNSHLLLSVIFAAGAASGLDENVGKARTNREMGSPEAV